LLAEQIRQPRVRHVCQTLRLARLGEELFGQAGVLDAQALLHGALDQRLLVAQLAAQFCLLVALPMYPPFRQLG
jgi:hypothetical protein